jgi:hypothetical protein
VYKIRFGVIYVAFVVSVALWIEYAPVQHTPQVYYPYVLNWEYSVLPVPDYRLRYLTLTLSHIIIYKSITIVFLSHVLLELWAAIFENISSRFFSLFAILCNKMETGKRTRISKQPERYFGKVLRPWNGRCWSKLSRNDRKRCSRNWPNNDSSYEGKYKYHSNVNIDYLGYY